MIEDSTFSESIYKIWFGKVYWYQMIVFLFHSFRQIQKKWKYVWNLRSGNLQSSNENIIKGTEFNPMESVYKFRRRFLNLLHFELSLRDSVILSILVYGQLYWIFKTARCGKRPSGCTYGSLRIRLVPKFFSKICFGKRRKF